MMSKPLTCKCIINNFISRLKKCHVSFYIIILNLLENHPLKNSPQSYRLVKIPGILSNLPALILKCLYVFLFCNEYFIIIFIKCIIQS